MLARTGKFADALSKHNEALDLARRTGDQAEIARTYRMLGFLHRNLDDEELAAQNIREALTHLGPRDVREGIALRGELSRSLLKMGQIDEAARYGEEASEAAMSLGSPPNKVNSFTALSDVRLAQGRVDDADLWSRRAAEAVQFRGDPRPGTDPRQPDPRGRCPG
ncbi:MAG: tetratricopeptide repeat protein [Rhodanobacteraceae bacterium]|nr:tetratricopeptide repeat protein [Rhodanobacteraceae bacterium]